MASHICGTCGYLGKPDKILRGSRKTELVMWLVLLIPGPFYSIWRYTKIIRRCPYCKKATMLSTKTMEGFELLKQQEDDLVHGRKALIPENYEAGRLTEKMVTPQQESSFKGMMVQRDIREEIKALKEKNNE